MQGMWRQRYGMQQPESSTHWARPRAVDPLCGACYHGCSRWHLYSSSVGHFKGHRAMVSKLHQPVAEKWCCQ